MRYFEIKGKRCHLSEKSYKRLLRRFNPDRATLNPDTDRFNINEKCICPEGSVSQCPKCEIGKQTTRKQYGKPLCIQWLFAVTAFKAGELALQVSYLSWSKGTDKKARAELRKLREKMLAIPYTYGGAEERK